MSKTYLTQIVEFVDDIEKHAGKMAVELSSMQIKLLFLKMCIGRHSRSLERLKESVPQKVYYVEYSGVYSYEFEFFKNQKNAEKRVEELKAMGDDGAYYKEVLLKD